ncbi:hypothetical protein [Leifsonia poae]|uniref:hypothetical protein n=1 Tax=Leifsonia poae TaxID=110933 RepID=UPI003D676FF0
MNQNYGTAVDPDMAAQRANALLESEIKARIEAVRGLAQRQVALDTAIAEYESAWQSAAQAGWTEDKLRDIGLRAPEPSTPFAGRRAAAPEEQSAPMAPVVQLAPPVPVAAPVAPTVVTAQSIH